MKDVDLERIREIIVLREERRLRVCECADCETLREFTGIKRETDSAERARLLKRGQPSAS